MIGMAYDHLAHGAVGYAFASSPSRSAQPPRRRCTSRPCRTSGGPAC
jgi:hypothetical protein